MAHKLKVIAEPGKQEIIMSRTFDAPRDLVFKATSDPNLIPRWWGPRYLTTTVDEMEVKPGGRWRFVQRDDKGNEFAFNGVYHEVAAPERVITTFEFENLPPEMGKGHVVLQKVTFEEVDGKTVYTEKSVYLSVEDRDGMIESGMEGGAIETMDRLEEILATMK
jgi:uncharacterized protein YndB with AHSA1/START domain